MRKIKSGTLFSKPNGFFVQEKLIGIIVDKKRWAELLLTKRTKRKETKQ